MSGVKCSKGMAVDKHLAGKKVNGTRSPLYDVRACQEPVLLHSMEQERECCSEHAGGVCELFGKEYKTNRF